MDTAAREARAPAMDRRGTARLAPGDRALLAWRARGTLAQWQAADRVLRASDGAVAAAHERAVAVALGHLQRFGSVDELVAHWRADRYRRLGDAGEPPGGTVEAWVQDASRAAGGAPPVNQEVVAGAALWRRAQALLLPTPR